MPNPEILDEFFARLGAESSGVPGTGLGLVVTKGLGSLPGVYFRGLGSNSSVFNLEPSVPIYQDGEYFGHQRDYVTPLYDVDQPGAANSRASGICRSSWKLISPITGIIRHCRETTASSEGSGPPHFFEATLAKVTEDSNRSSGNSSMRASSATSPR